VCRIVEGVGKMKRKKGEKEGTDCILRMEKICAEGAEE
jgi:hypothetical protein